MQHTLQGRPHFARKEARFIRKVTHLEANKEDQPHGA